MRVRRPEARSDRPDPWTLIAIALASLAAGLSVARGLTRETLESASPAETHTFPGLQTQLTPAVTAEPTLAEAPPSAQPLVQPTPAEPESATTASAPTVAEHNSEPIEPSTPAPNVVSEPAQAAPAAAVEATPPPPPAMPAPPAALEPSPPAVIAATEARRVARKRAAIATPAAAPTAPAPPATPNPASVGATPQVELGIVAYTKCDGVPQLDKRFPCPRDLRLEARVRRAINALDRCALKPEQRGQGNVRLEFERDLPVKVSIESPRRGGFDRAAVSHCTGHALADMRTSFKPDQMVVLFYFGLR